MTLRIAPCFLIIGAAALTWPSKAEACICGGTHSSSAAVKGADVVFVGTVAKVERPRPRTQTNADGSISISVGTEPLVTTFDVAHVYLGTLGRQVIIVGDGTDCDEPFGQGETWLVYARGRDGRVTTSKCTRTRLRASASSDLAYLDGLEQKRPQGIVYGDVFRRITGANGQPALQALFEPLQVIALSASRRTELTTDKSGPYQFVLPPGDYDVWVERAGRPVGQRRVVHVADGSDQRLALIVDYKN